MINKKRGFSRGFNSSKMIINSTKPSKNTKTSDLIEMNSST
jgi:hypothetical protein